MKVDEVTEYLIIGKGHVSNCVFISDAEDISNKRILLWLAVRKGICCISSYLIETLSR